MRMHLIRVFHLDWPDTVHEFICMNNLVYRSRTILAVNGVDLTHMLHTDMVNLIKESGRTITLKIGPPLPFGKHITATPTRLILSVADERAQDFPTQPFTSMSNQSLTNGIRPSSSSPMVTANGNHHPMPTNTSYPTTNGNHTIRNAFSHNPLNILERYPITHLMFSQ